MTDEELIYGLRNNALWVTTQEAAARIEQLGIEVDETHKEAMSCLKMWGSALASQREVETKLTRAVGIIKHLINEAPEGDEDRWHIALDDATAVLKELEK